MTCYNCGYKISVVVKDNIGWLCEWCSDNELGEINYKKNSEIVERLRKRLDIIKNNDNNYQVGTRAYLNEAVIELALQEILGGK